MGAVKGVVTESVVEAGIKEIVRVSVGRRVKVEDEGEWGGVENSADLESASHRNALLGLS